jgi:hypothetical protein
MSDNSNYNVWYRRHDSGEWKQTTNFSPLFARTDKEAQRKLYRRIFRGAFIGMSFLAMIEGETP